MGRTRRSIPRSRVPLHRRMLLDPVAWRYWALAALLAVVVAAGVGRALARASAVQERWGRTRPVLVADRTIGAGDVLQGRVTPARWPAGLVPPGWPTKVGAGTKATRPLAPGTPVTADVVAVTGEDPGDEDRRRIAVATGEARLSLRRGDRVDVWATTDPSVADGELATRRMAVDAVVTSVDPRSVVIAVRPGEVADVAEATTLATVTLVATSG